MPSGQTEFFSFQLAGSASNPNFVANSRYATLGRPAQVDFYAVQDGATSQGDAKIEISLGNVIVRDLSPIPAFTAGLGPDLDKHWIGGGQADMNDRIIARAQNDGAAASNFRILMRVVFLP